MSISDKLSLKTSCIGNQIIFGYIEPFGNETMKSRKDIVKNTYALLINLHCHKSKYRDK